MLKDYRLLALLSLVTAIIIFASIGAIFEPEYALHQRNYSGLTKTEDMPVEVTQVNVKTGSGVLVDRCQSCHRGVNNEKAKDFDPPLGMHKAIVSGMNTNPHNFGKMGCVVCHEGNGRGLTMKDAHGMEKHWYAELLKGEAVQASCVKCHVSTDQGIRGADRYNRGKHLFVEEACWACHTIDGISAGKSAPELNDVGNTFSLAYLRESIVNPKANSSVSKMPKFFWVDQSHIVDALVIFLKGQRKNNLRDMEKGPVDLSIKKINIQSVESADSETGRLIFMGARISSGNFLGGCVNCHAVRSSQGTVEGGINAPDLTFSHRSRGSRYITSHIKNSKNDVMDSNMPLFEGALNEHEIQSLVLYLQTLAYEYPDRTASGKKFYENYCMSCHGEKLDGQGPYYELLDPLPRNFRSQFVASYNERFKNSIQKGISGTAMSPWKAILTDGQIERIVDYIKSMAIDGNKKYVRLEAPLPKPGDAERKHFGKNSLVLNEAAIEDGTDAYMKFCTSCHGKLANGKGPNAYNLVHPLPRNLLNTPYFLQAELTNERLYNSILLSVPGTSMPAHDHLTDQSIIDMIAFINSLHKGGYQ